ncbi:MAG: hypothetical protein JST89_16290 [Cyanobacteria bacterium SZAS-4]|nr:hypothetical protein [Cyanobacteria bacterium SZAS-4]
MQFEQIDNAEPRSFGRVQDLTNQANLSRSIHDLYKPICNYRSDMPSSLDFGSGTDLYDSNYTDTMKPSVKVSPKVEQTREQPELIAQGIDFPNVVEIYKNEFEHKYRGRELATIEKDIPKEKWNIAYQAFPELKQLGEKTAVMLMKAIIANELDHYGGEDVTQDAVASTGHGGGLHGRSIGYGQISPDGVRNMAKQFDWEVAHHQRAVNPLAKYEKMNDDKLAQELANPANTPLFVAAHIALDLKNLNRHARELQVTPAALGYWYNADMVYAKLDKKHEHLMTKKEAKAKHIQYDPALPTDIVLQKSEHAANIRKWLEQVN